MEVKYCTKATHITQINLSSYINQRSWKTQLCITHARAHTKTELVFYWLRNALKVIASGQSSQINCFLSSLKETSTSPSVIKCELLTRSPMTFWYKSKVLQILDKLIVFAALCLVKNVFIGLTPFWFCHRASIFKEDGWIWLPAWYISFQPAMSSSCTGICLFLCVVWDILLENQSVFIRYIYLIPNQITI